MGKWLIGLSVLTLLLFTTWLGLAWYTANQFLTLGVIDFDAKEHAVILQQQGIAADEAEFVEIAVNEVTLAGTLIRAPQSKPCGIILLPGIGGTRNQVLPAVRLFRNLV